MKESVTVTRIKVQMEALNVTQTELARRVGCSQASMGKILQGVTRRSRLLPDIAKVLQTSVEYLTGQIADPARQAAGEILDLAEQDLLMRLRALSQKDRATMQKVTRALAHSASGEQA